MKYILLKVERNLVFKQHIISVTPTLLIFLYYLSEQIFDSSDYFTI